MNKEKNTPFHLQPLREPTLFILLSLAREEKHGYAITKDVEWMSGGKIRLSTGTLYEALARLLEQELILRVDAAGTEPEEGPGEKHPGKPRKAYRLSPLGRSLLEAEVSRMKALVKLAQQRLQVES